MIELHKQTDLSPKCGHCQTELTTVWYEEIRTQFGRRYIYFCPHCRAVMGISHRKGFWMG